MSTDHTTERASVTDRVENLIARTVVASRGALSRRDGRAAFAVSAAVYVVLYLYGIRHLGFGQWGYTVSIVDDPLSRMTRAVGPAQWEPIGLLVAGPIELLVSPLNIVLGSVLAALVALNLAVSVVAWRGPKACRLGPGAGAAAGIPGLLSGVVCCGPTILLVVGLQATAGLITLFQWLLPIAVVALVGTLLWVGSQVQVESI